MSEGTMKKCEDKKKLKLRAIKRQATIKEYNRVFLNMILPPRDIVVWHDGARYVRESWQSINRFGWGKWEKK